MIATDTKLKHCIAALVLFAIVHPAFAGPVLDQSYVPTSWTSIQARNIDYQGQSFTVGMNGQLASISLDLWRFGASTSMNFNLFPIVGGTAEVTQGVSLVVPESSIPVIGPDGGNTSPINQWMSINLSAFNLSVQAGQQWGMVVHSAMPNEVGGITWFSGCEGDTTCGTGAGHDGGYAGGSPIWYCDPCGNSPSGPLTDFTVRTRTDFDQAFATYVIPAPEPDSLALMLCGLAGIALYSLRLRRNS